jgi:hypothetical protein
MYKIIEALVSRGETLEYAEDALEVMIGEVCFGEDDVYNVLAVQGLVVTAELVEELYELCGDALQHLE